MTFRKDKWVLKRMKVKSLSRVRLFATPWTVVYQALQSMEFSRQKYWSGLPSGVTGKCGLGVQNEAGKRLIQFCQGEHIGYSKHPVPTIQEKTLHMDITRWSILKSD